MPENSNIQRLGPIKSFFLYHIIDNPLFWLGVITVLLYASEAMAAGIYASLGGTALAPVFSAIYEWGAGHNAFWWGVGFVVVSVLASYVRYKVTHFSIDDGILIVSRGRFSFNPLCLFQRVDYTVALNLIYDVDVNKSLFQYIFGGGDVYVRTASSDIFHLEFINNPNRLRQYLLDHSGVKNKPVIGIY